jgi:hypothetical protein
MHYSPSSPDRSPEAEQSGMERFRRIFDDLHLPADDIPEESGEILGEKFSIRLDDAWKDEC